ncbi:class I SAM-dependent DNA methyltransferase [Roseibium aggregatum]|uniref:Class I SAM-dependent methyltransferase n=1 Tax=Roseibium aggregatum TaxID=187304 RepID=A0A939EE49_9HYPH|nr:class I SAM-dependent methyltransferase [Roseibium aggregatum]MBN9671480.1 class I SAM-dependent methyltransferase [Roseibium aggregatum]
MTESSKPETPDSLSLKAGSTDSETVASYYDQFAETYDTTLAGWNYHAPDETVALMAPHLLPGARILDVGCGTGLVSEALKKRASYRVDGIDISPASLTLAEQRGTYERLICHDLQKHPLPCRDDDYDAAISVGVLTYIEDLLSLFRDLCRCVRGGGVIAFTERSDLWQTLDLDGKLKALADEDLWSVLHVSEPRAYLPGNKDFAEEIKVIHTLCRVC